MNLPDYFFADLPPEATLTPTMMAAACDALRRNREKYLLPRPTKEIVKLLCEIAAEWLSPENQFRRLALELGPAETGFSKAVLEQGLDGFFRRFTPESFQALLEQELGDAASVTGDAWRVTREETTLRHASRVTSGAARNFSSTLQRAICPIPR